MMTESRTAIEINHPHFLSGADDCQWLRETALRGYDLPDFRSFTFDGHEDCPTEIALYATEDPEMHDRPLLVYRLYHSSASNLGQYFLSGTAVPNNWYAA